MQGGDHCGGFRSPDVYVSTTDPVVSRWIEETVAGRLVPDTRDCLLGKLCVRVDQCQSYQNLKSTFNNKTAGVRTRKHAGNRMRYSYFVLHVSTSTYNLQSNKFVKT